MELLQMIVVTAVTLGILVTVHEFGHFWVARRCGVKVLRFSIGFGKPLLRWSDKLGTEYALSAIPLGGYVKMLDEREGEVPPELLSASFTRQSVHKRIAIAAAGPIANFLLAIIVYWGMFVTGVSGVVPIIDTIKPGSLAEAAGLSKGQEIVAIDGEATPTWQTLYERLVRRIGESGSLRISAKYPDSDMVYDSTVELDNWLAGSESPDMIDGLGVTLWHPKSETVIGGVSENTPAARAGLQVGDRIVRADGIEFNDWESWTGYVRARPGQSIVISVLRDGVAHDVTIVPERKLDAQGKAFGQIGVMSSVAKWPDHMLRDVRYSPVAALGAAVKRTGSMSLVSLESIKKMILGMISPKNLSGPITIAKVATASAKSGLEPYLGFLAFFSVSLAVLNLLPIPVLDGGHILFALPELFTGRPVSEKIQAVGYQIGLFIIVGIMMLALCNDLVRP